jgi:hypothetical protein
MYNPHSLLIFFSFFSGKCRLVVVRCKEVLSHVVINNERPSLGALLLLLLLVVVVVVVVLDFPVGAARRTSCLLVTLSSG